MGSLLDSIKRIFGGVTAALSSRRSNPVLAPAWAAWERGDFSAAKSVGAELVACPETADAGHHMLALVAHVSGDHAGALAQYGQIDTRYPWLVQLDEPVLASYVHLKDWRGAKAFANTRPIGKQGATRKRLELAAERPLAIEMREGLVELAFTDDDLTPFMPGFPVRINGQPAVARLDTGGAFVHLSSEQAAALGIQTVACEKDFAALTWGKIGYGIADLEIGAIRLVNVPVAVHKGVLPAKQMASAFGVELGPIVGTNVLQQFLATIDGPNRRLILSRRGEPTLRANHLERLQGKATEVPFVMWGDHFMIAPGSMGVHAGLNLFVDSGLVVATPDQGQGALLASQSTLAAWNVEPPKDGPLANLPGELAIGSASRERLTAFRVSDRTWRSFGKWGGIRVDALISWGYLKHFSWTIDFDRQLYALMS